MLVYHACAYADVLVFCVCMYVTYVRMCQYVPVCGYHVHALVYGSVVDTLTCTSKGLSKHQSVCLISWIRSLVCLRAHKYVYTCMHCIVSNPHLLIYGFLQVYVYTCTRTHEYAHSHTYTHTYMHTNIQHIYTNT